MKKPISFILILSLISWNYISCRKEKEFPHALPSVETMEISFTHFVLPSRAVEKWSDTKVIVDNNWPFAAGLVSDWRTLAANLFVPITAYRAVTGKTASKISTDTWEWNHNGANISGGIYKIRLTGQVTGSKVKWKMYVSGSFSEFKWMEGTSNAGGSEGEWTFYESHTSPQTVRLQVDWKKSGTNIEKVKYSYLYNDSYVEYGLTSGSYRHRYIVHYYNESFGKFSDVNIEWVDTGAGRVQSTDYLDGSWQCWDFIKTDTKCN